MDIQFACTQCGQCCQNLQLPLTIDEAKSWLDAGHDLQLLYEASPWSVEPEADDLPALHKRRHSFSGSKPDIPPVAANSGLARADRCANGGLARTRSPAKQKLSAALGFDRAAVFGEGFVLYSPDRQALTAALSWATASAEDQVDFRSWRLVSPRQTTLDALASSGALVEQPPNVTAGAYEYLGTGSDT